MTSAEVLDLGVKLCLEASLYTKVPVEVVKGDRPLRDLLRQENLGFDCYCIHCKKHTPFKSKRGDSHYPVWRQAAQNKVLSFGTYNLDMFCQRDDTHIYTYLFRHETIGDEETITKIGQTPSLEDIARSDMEKYRDVLDAADFSELHRAGGLISHGVAIGAFVYLRRIFERLIYRHHDEFTKTNGPIDGFDGLKMDQKIEALKSTLPSLVVGNKAIYGILSKGIHELDEAACKRFYPIMHAVVISILEEDLQAREKAKSADALTKALGAISTEIGTKKVATAAKTD